MAGNTEIIRSSSALSPDTDEAIDLSVLAFNSQLHPVFIAPKLS